MTYAELAAARGIDKQSAARLTFRRHWRRQKDNHGTVRVFVPTDWQDRSRDASPDVSRDAPHDESRDMSRVISALEGAVDTLRDQLTSAEKRADRAEIRADEATNRAILAEQAILGERARADEAESRANSLRERGEGLLRQLATAKAMVVASREQLEAVERRADAERERADRAEAAAAHERQDFLDVEVLTRRELDTLRERLAEAEKGREVAEAAVLQAAQTADEVLQTAAARQRLGLLARLKAAWRGQ